MTNYPITPFVPPWLLKNTHLQTILPKFLPQKTPNYDRKLVKDSQGDTYVAYDFVHACHSDKTRLVVMFCGLEGSSQSHYAKAFANYANKLGVDAVIVHYRGCGGVENCSPYDYHAGDTAEIHHVLTQLNKTYPVLMAVGVSLGGNMLAKYLGDYGDKALCQKAVVVSAPLDLPSSSKALHRFVARQIYVRYLLSSLKQKAYQKTDDKRFYQMTTLDEFDHCYTAPRNGFVSGSDYYEQSSALPTLKNITRPTLIIASCDDPFLGNFAATCDVADCVQLLYSKHGGHVGFLGQHQGGLKAILTNGILKKGVLKPQNLWHLDWLPKTEFAFFGVTK